MIGKQRYRQQALWNMDYQVIIDIRPLLLDIVYTMSVACNLIS